MSEELRAAAQRYTEARIALLAARDVQTAWTVKLAGELGRVDNKYLTPEQIRAAVHADEQIVLATQVVRDCLIELFRAEGALIALQGLQVLVNAEPR